MTEKKEGLLLHPSLSLEEHLSKFPDTFHKRCGYTHKEMEEWRKEHEKLLEAKVSQIQALKTRYNKHLEAKSTRQSGFSITMWMLSEKDFERFTEEVLALLEGSSTHKPTCPNCHSKEHVRFVKKKQSWACSDCMDYFDVEPEKEGSIGEKQ